MDPCIIKIGFVCPVISAGFGASQLGIRAYVYKYLGLEGLGLGHSRVRTSPLGVVRCSV